MPDLSVVIPARNEMWLSRTIDDVLAHSKMDTEVIVVLDGAWPEVGLQQHPKVTVIYLPEPIGQRAATNLGVKQSDARYIMKLDAHCSLSDGFDKVLIEHGERLGFDVTQIPAQRNLHIWDYICDACGRREYQTPPREKCAACDQPVRMEIVWKGRGGTRSTCWTFNSEPKFQYGGTEHRELDEHGIGDVMSSLGACFFMRRERFLELGGLDEENGIWGSFGIEIACKSWLSGGRQVVNNNCEFAHFFRVGGHGFPYPLSGRQQERAKQGVRDTFIKNKWPLQVRSFKWLVEKFWPISGWTEEQKDVLPEMNSLQIEAIPRRGVVYYTDSRVSEDIRWAAKCQLVASVPQDWPIVCVSLKPEWWPKVRPIKRIVLSGKRGYLQMFKQILAGLEAIDCEIIYFAEHDVLYHPSHFESNPSKPDVILYNQHVYKVDAGTGHALHYRCSQTSGLCGYRSTLLDHYRKRVELVERQGYSRGMGFEPGTHRRPERVDDLTSEIWMSTFPNVDIRHDTNLTPSRWRKDQFRNQKYTEGWTESDRVPGWGITEGRFKEFLSEVMNAVQQAVA